MERPLSELKTFDLFTNAPTPMNFALALQFSTTPDEMFLRAALDRLGQHYPKLGARTTESSFSVFPLSIMDQSDVLWQDVVVEQLGTSFDLKIESYVRLVLLKRADGSADLVITFHHGIADGMAGIFFLQDLLTLLDDADAELESLSYEPGMIEKIPDSIRNSFKTKMHTFGMKAGVRLMQLMGLLGKQWPAADRLIEGKRPWEHMALTTRMLSAEQTSQLVSCCKTEGTSVHAAVSTAWLRARMELIGDEKWKRTVSSPVNLRDYIGAGRAFGLVMSNIVVTVDCSPSRDFWDVAFELKKLMMTDVENGEMYAWLAQTLGMISLPPDIIVFAMNVFFTQPPGYDFSMTNLGRLKLPHAENVNAVYGPLVNGGEQEFTVGVSTLNNHLTMSFLFREFVLSKQMGEQMADRVLELLADAVDL